MPELIVLEHTAGAGPSAFTEVLDARTSIAPWRSVDVPSGAPLPTVDDDLAGLVVLGGTMSVTDADDQPWMLAELDLLKAAAGAGTPILGVCLGAQLLGRALGGEVTRRTVPEVGYLPLVRTAEAAEDAVFGGWADGTAPFFLHEDEVSAVPLGAEVMLTGSDGIPGWRAGSARAVQFHPEVDAEQLTRWAELDSVTGLLAEAGVTPAALLDEARRRDRFAVSAGRALLGRFLDAVVRPHLG